MCFLLAVGELGALEEVIGQLTSRGLLRPMTLKALWLICSNAHDHVHECVSLHQQQPHSCICESA